AQRAVSIKALPRRPRRLLSWRVFIATDQTPTARVDPRWLTANRSKLLDHAGIHLNSDTKKHYGSRWGDVAQALLPAASRLISTHFRERSRSAIPCHFRARLRAGETHSYLVPTRNLLP